LSKKYRNFSLIENKFYFKKGLHIVKNVIIVGAGGLARMLYSWLPDFFCGENWEMAGFISDRLSDLNGYDYPAPIIGTIQDYVPKENDVFIMAIADTKVKLSIANLLEQRGAKFISIIHPTAILGHNVKLGRGCVICPHAIVTCDIEMGNFVMLNLAVTIGHDVKIDDGCTINAHSDITGFTQLGKGVFLGSHAVVTPNVKVGDFAKVGAGSVVLKKVPSDTTVFGIPAKRI
jgi:sugar O-acyltransferase (sialic acid O-acetyltransferase NeuD family)